jgi:DNA polymerase-3 subunit alpha
MGRAFVHLHNHSEYSMLDGALRLGPLVERVAAHGAPAVALTDRGNMFGAVQFLKACRSQGVKPIFGCEIGLTGGRRDDATNREAHHLILLAGSVEGYANLVRLVSLAWVEGGVAGSPRIDLETLARHRQGLVGMSACLGGWLPQQVLLRGEAAGRDAMGALKDAFEPGAFYVELQRQGFPEQGPLNEILIRLARGMDLPLVASNVCHYLDREDAHAQMVLQCIGTGQAVSDKERTHHHSSELFVKSPEEMVELFRDLPEAVDNTLAIAERCAGVVDPLSSPKLPRFEVPEGLTEEGFLRKLAADGLDRRIAELEALGQTVDREAYRARLALELDVIVGMGFPGYFLIVQEFINWAKTQGIPVGPGRGSGAGSIVAWALRITNLDPIPYGLLFERFLNPERVSMPDFDVDFCMDRRDLVIDHVREKYGATSVGQIATFHLLKSRSVVRDVGRVMGMTPADAGRVATMIPEPVQGRTVPIAAALKQEKRLEAVYEQDPKVKELLDTAMALENLTRHAGMHAAGVVISEGPLWDHVPVFCPEPDAYVTQFDKDDVESAGLVKFDFLGLKTLTVIDVACRLIGRRPDREGVFDIETIPLDDPATFALLQSGETTNVFQLESSGMQTLFRQLRPDRFEDIVAAVALYRPGPLGSGMDQDFIQRKHGRARVTYPHPDLEPILAPTYGVIVYQEQVMQIAQAMAGYSLGGADLLRRAMGKKKIEEMAKQKVVFLEGAESRGYPREDAEKVFNLMEHFAAYGFNKSHSAAYALLTYQTAYLKAHYPVEFVCATLSADKDKTEKVVRTVSEGRGMGITVLPPDVNESEIDFTVVYEPVPLDDPTLRRKGGQPAAQKGVVRDPYRPKIRFGLGGVRGIGTSALEAVFEARSGDGEPLPSEDAALPGTGASPAGAPAPEAKQPFVDLFDFAARVDLRRVNKNVVEAMVQCGAFDAVHGPQGVSRAAAFAAIDRALERGRKMEQERSSGQTSLFGLLGGGDEEATRALERVQGEFPNVPAWDLRETLQREKQTLGFYVSGHPLDRHMAELGRFCSNDTRSLAACAEGTQVVVGGLVEGYRERTTKGGDKIAFFELEDAHGRVEVIVRPKVLATARVQEVLHTGDPVVATGTVQFERDRNAAPGSDGGEATQAKLILEEAEPLADALRAKTRAVRVRIPVDRADPDKLETLRALLSRYPGRCPVTLELTSAERWAVTLGPNGLAVDPSESLRDDVDRVFGVHVLELR